MRPRVEDIQFFTADAFNITMSDMTAPDRERRKARPRQIAMYLSRELTGRSLPEIGRRFGGRDHTTVLHACRRIEHLIAGDEMLASEINSLRGRINVCRPKGFNVISLGEWMAVARNVRVPHVAAKFIADIAVDDLRCFEDTSDDARSLRLRGFFATVYAATLGGHMMRWDHCAPEDLKHLMARGGVVTPPSVRLTIDDMRVYELLDDLPPTQTLMTVWRRPWAPARYEGGWPVEYRVFVERGKVIGISNYYPQRPLPPSGQVDFEINLARVYAEAMVLAVPMPLANPQIEAAGLPSDELSCTLDFIATPRGLLFLEGGPPFTSQWGAHPCCFTGRQHIAGVALQAPIKEAQP